MTQRGWKLQTRIRFLSVLTLCVVFGSLALAQPNPGGTWAVTGKDKNDTDWKATLFLEPLDASEYPPERFKGYFDWEGSNKTGGREYVVLATYDYKTRQLELRGAELEDADPNIKTSIYKVTMTEGADRLEDGSWQSSGVIPGVFEAERILEQPPSKKQSGQRVSMPAKERCGDGSCRVLPQTISN